jgi:hypothetical protein
MARIIPAGASVGVVCLVAVAEVAIIGRLTSS